MNKKADIIWREFTHFLRNNTSDFDEILRQDLYNIVSLGGVDSASTKEALGKLNSLLSRILQDHPDLEEIKKYKEELKSIWITSDHCTKNPPAWYPLAKEKILIIWKNFTIFSQANSVQVDTIFSQEYKVFFTQEADNALAEDYISRLNYAFFHILRANPELEEIKKYSEELETLQAIFDSHS